MQFLSQLFCGSIFQISCVQSAEPVSRLELPELSVQTVTLRLDQPSNQTETKLAQHQDWLSNQTGTELAQYVDWNPGTGLGHCSDWKIKRI